MVLVADRTCLHSRKAARPKHRSAVVFCVYDQFHLRGDHLLDILQQGAAHVFGKTHQCHPLLCAGHVVYQQHRFRREGILIRIPQGTVRANCGSYGQALQLHTVPTPTPHMPSQDRLIPHQVDFAIGKTLTRVNVGTAGLQVIAANFLSYQRNGKTSSGGMAEAMPFQNTLMLA